MSNSALYWLAGALLTIGGLVHLIPSLYLELARWFDGRPIIQILVGILSVPVGLYLMYRGYELRETGETPRRRVTG